MRTSLLKVIVTFVWKFDFKVWSTSKEKSIIFIPTFVDSNENISNIMINGQRCKLWGNYHFSFISVKLSGSPEYIQKLDFYRPLNILNNYT